MGKTGKKRHHSQGNVSLVKPIFAALTAEAPGTINVVLYQLRFVIFLIYFFSMRNSNYRNN